jgi:hypothetical protein
MNDLVLETLSLWHKQSKRTGTRDLVFPSPVTGKKMSDCNTAWDYTLKKAGIENFRWHDFASCRTDNVIVP